MSDEITKLTVDAETAPQRIDRWLAEQLPDTSRSQVQAAIKKGAVIVNGDQEAASYKVSPGDEIEIRVEVAPPKQPLQPLDMELDIVYEDEHLLVVNKPAGLVVHPAPGHVDDTLANALLARYGREIESVGGEERCGIVHRLDATTTGLMLVAKTPEAHEKLTADLAERLVSRRYLALTMGNCREGEGVIDRPIGRRKSERKRMGIRRDGRPSRTDYRVLHDEYNLALMLLQLHSGRTHQIRVHLQAFGKPVLGDRVYGWSKQRTISYVDVKLRPRLGPAFPDRQMLHAAGLGFTHPITGEEKFLIAAPPAEMFNLATKIWGGKFWENLAWEPAVQEGIDLPDPEPEPELGFGEPDTGLGFDFDEDPESELEASMEGEWDDGED